MSISEHQGEIYQLGLIGGGNIAFALAAGLIDQGFAAETICAADPLPGPCERMATLGVHILPQSVSVAAQAVHLVLAVKPQALPEVLREIRPKITSDQMVLSVAAGINIAQIKAGLGHERLPVVRAMPNTPVLISAGATALYGEDLSDAQKTFAEAMMAAVGLVRWVSDEAHLDAVTAVSGSGPAYFLLLMEEMVRTGCALGLAQEDAEALVKQTALGAARLALESEQDIAQLRRQVTSAGGTTAAALDVFADQGFGSLLRRALTAARDRAKALAQESSL